MVWRGTSSRALPDGEPSGHFLDGNFQRNNIKKNILHLHKRFWGERIDITDAEIERTYKLFLDTYRELHTAKNTALPYECTGRWDQNTGAALPMSMIGVTDDKYYTVRSWMAVITYMMLDWKYLYQ